jgi:hypothetical protein
MSGARHRERLDGTAFPAGVVEILDQQGQRRAGGAPFHHPAQDAHRIAFELHARTRAVAVLAAGQVAIDGGRVESQPGGQPVENGGQGGAV